MTIQKFTFHTHSNFSDGKSTVEEMVQAAEKLNFKQIGITDHCVIHKNIKKGPIWDREILRNRTHMFNDSFESFYERASRHLEEIREVSKKYSIKVYTGFEVDFFTYDGWLENFKEMADRLDLDYLISGNHYMTLAEIGEVSSVRRIKDYGLSDEKVKYYIAKHFKDMVKAIESGLFEFMAHIDFIRFGDICGEFDFKEERMEVIEALAKNNVAFELSTKGLNSLGDFYPANWMLRELIDRNVPVVISDDAHHIFDIGQHFEKAEDLLKVMECKNRWSFSDKK